MHLNFINKSTSYIGTDFSKAFDTVEHDTLIYILDKLGVGDLLLSWLKSYLVDRYQFVDLLNNKSENIKVTSGVPQDGYLSLLLFNIFINNISTLFHPVEYFYLQTMQTFFLK